MTEQPRKNNGQFSNKLAPAAPSSSPDLPSIPNRADLAGSFESYNQTSAEQEKVMQDGFADVGNSLDAVITIYKERQARREAEHKEFEEQLGKLKDQLDQIALERKRVEEELERRRNSSFLSKIANAFSRGK